MTLIASIAGTLLIAAAAVQLAISICFQKSFAKKQPLLLPVDQQEKAVVIMSVRGCDPSLINSLKGVLNQNYADYSVLLVADHPTDQAWDLVHRIKLENDPLDRLKILEMVNPSETCSLKCHAIVQALGHIDEETVYVALLDADVQPHPGWLTELTGPLQDPAIGGVTGNQWFEPDSSAGIGSLVRSTWNGGALVPTIFFANPWAGSFAMRVKDVWSSGLDKTWTQSVVDDGPIKQAIGKIGLRIEFAPSLIMVNREPCTFGYANRWVTRMLTWSRLYEKTFYLSIIHALFSNTVMLANFGILLWSTGLGSISGGLISAFSLIAAGIMCNLAYLFARSCVAQSCQLRGAKLGPMTLRRQFEVFWLSGLGHLVYGISCARAILIKRIKWRDITYELKSATQVKRLDYQPFVAHGPSKVSI
ncbi:MAG: glycosyltransferase family 2 protein [Mariniblastus sp.]|nr:glycosyltransferase family 2 protein [Mariniblastus sp.]